LRFAGQFDLQRALVSLCPLFVLSSFVLFVFGLSFSSSTLLGREFIMLDYLFQSGLAFGTINLSLLWACLLSSCKMLRRFAFACRLLTFVFHLNAEMAELWQNFC